MTLFVATGCGMLAPAPDSGVAAQVVSDEEQERLRQEQMETSISADFAALAQDRENQTQALEAPVFLAAGLPLRSRWQVSVAHQPTEPSLARELRSMRVRGFVVEEEGSLRAVVDQLRIMTGLPLVVMPPAESSVNDEGVSFNLNMTSDISARSLLNIIAELAGDQVAWTIRHDAVIFTTTEKVRASYALQMHDIRRLTRERRDFSGPRLSTIRLLGELEDEDGGGPFGGVEVTPAQHDADEVLELVRNSVAPGTWDDAGVSIDVSGSGLLLVRHSPQVQREVARFLMRLGS